MDRAVNTADDDSAGAHGDRFVRDMVVAHGCFVQPRRTGNNHVQAQTDNREKGRDELRPGGPTDSGH